MIQEAIKKLRDEIEKENQEYIKVIGDLLINVISKSEEAAKKIMVQAKNIVGSLKAIEEVAKRKAKNGCAVMTDEEGMKIVYKYFEIDLKDIYEDGNSSSTLKKQVEEIPKAEFSIELDDLF